MELSPADQLNNQLFLDIFFLQQKIQQKEKELNELKEQLVVYKLKITGKQWIISNNTVEYKINL